MFDVGFSELLLLAIIALVVLGPEKLPHAARMTGAWVGRIRRMIVSVQADIENEVAAAEMRERIKQEMEKVKAASGLDEAQETLNTALEAPKPERTEKP
jgi:sec-independent protein translocase protein TatB